MENVEILQNVETIREAFNAIPPIEELKKMKTEEKVMEMLNFYKVVAGDKPIKLLDKLAVYKVVKRCKVSSEYSKGRLIKDGWLIVTYQDPNDKTGNNDLLLFNHDKEITFQAARNFINSCYGETAKNKGKKKLVTAVVNNKPIDEESKPTSKYSINEVKGMVGFYHKKHGRKSNKKTTEDVMSFLNTMCDKSKDNIWLPFKDLYMYKDYKNNILYDMKKECGHNISRNTLIETGYLDVSSAKKDGCFLCHYTKDEVTANDAKIIMTWANIKNTKFGADNIHSEYLQDIEANKNVTILEQNKPIAESVETEQPESNTTEFGSKEMKEINNALVNFALDTRTKIDEHYDKKKLEFDEYVKEGKRELREYLESLKLELKNKILSGFDQTPTK